MSYEKQTWQSGDVITAAKMNHIEDGIAAGGGVFIINSTKVVIEADEYQYQLDKTYNQIYSAIMQGKICYIKYEDDVLERERLSPIKLLENSDSYYLVLDDSYDYEANSADVVLKQQRVE